ncbi:MAG TPA: cation-translocating P-type ATPase, partial [Phycisphaerae bacterium]
METILSPQSLWQKHAQLIAAIAAGILLLLAKTIGGTIDLATSDSAGTLVNALVAVSFSLGFYFGASAAIESLLDKKLDINLLMVLGAVLAIFVGSAAEGALLLFLFTLSGALEHLAMQRTHAALESLMKLFPKEALVLGDDGQQRLVPLENLRAGDKVLVKPGENVSADGEVIEGSSAVDESAITGEFLPREKMPGSTLYAGTLNKAGRLIFRVSRPARDTALAKIIHLVSKASQEKAPVERLFDKVGSAYTVAVLSASFTICLLMGLVFGIPWLSAFDSQGILKTGAIYRAITLLIVASPCALIISTPVVLLSAIATCARRGIILKGGRHLESLAALKALVFDKTGTLTTGQVQLVALEILSPPASDLGATDLANPPEPSPPDHANQNCATPSPSSRNLGSGETLRQKLLQIAASLEANSTHPLAAAVVRAAESQSLNKLPVADFHQEAGQGIRGIVDGTPCIIGSPALLTGFCHTRTLERLSQRIDAAHEAGETAVVLFCAGHAAVLRFSDTLRPDVARVTASLHAMGIKPLVMLTGDHLTVASAVAATLGLDEVHAQLLPEQKLTAVAQLVSKYRAVAMIGDGINDAPALARATVGIAMGSIGSDAAMQAADVVLLSGDIDRLPWLIQTARRARRVMAQNLIFAILVIIILTISSLTGYV